ncbi:hypothetical protein DA69_01415 [Brevundimonas naejangsanensis]|uniref:PIN domain-containing protein n=1 Tax=Brevundimonas naejangsanensis TaxID=588932 RepID=A0A172Y311_9CAUL|nr:hypothetical protein [Brevundimonas naejangsanensis]ANF53542.1 hypothetical protein DA69_01415 [Brevundimonas naejangsanensis]
MIRILDANALIDLCDAGQKLAADEKCFVPDEIAAELSGSEANERWLAAQPFEAIRLEEHEFLEAFARYLNTFPGVSFYSLKGFGDVAILATIEILLRRAPPTPTLSREVFPWDTVYLVSDDRKLRNFITRTFGDRVVLQKLQDFRA